MITNTRFLRWIGMSVLVVLLLSGVVIGLCWPRVVSALPLRPQTQERTVTPTATGRHAPTTSGTPSPSAKAATWTTLAHDTFHRADQRFWGKAADGQLWGANANSVHVFSITDNTGQVANGSGTYDALLGPMATNAEIVCSGMISRFDHTSFGAVLRWNDVENWYKASLDGTYLILSKKVAGVSTRLAMSPFAASAGTSYTLRFRIEGTTLLAKAWPTGTPEPPAWLVMIHDTSLPSGFGGLRFMLKKSVTVNIGAFSETGTHLNEGRGTS
jgi:hypothetical protein